MDIIKAFDRGRMKDEIHLMRQKNAYEQFKEIIRALKSRNEIRIKSEHALTEGINVYAQSDMETASVRIYSTYPRIT